MSYSFTEFLNDHKSQLISSDIPEYFWNDLFCKFKEEIYDIGDICDLKLNEDHSQVLCVVDKDLKASDTTNIFLIDNAWTFEMENVKSQLRTVESLRERVSVLLGLDTEDASVEDVVDCIMDNLWNQVRYYDVRMKISEERTRLWYILDEVGSFIHHSEHPNMRIVPFIYTPRATCYSVAWLIDDLRLGDSLSVNRVEHIIDPYLRNCISHVWTGAIPTESSPLVTMSAEFFQSHQSEETRPDMSVPNLGCLDSANRTGPLRVYSDVTFVKHALTDPRFTLTESRDDADVLWLFDHFRDYEALSRASPRTLINQFPAEMSLTTKDLLSALGSGSSWSVVTYNMRTELAEFIARYHADRAALEDQLKQAAAIHNCSCNCHHLNVACGVCDENGSDTCALTKAEVGPVWIVKPWNMARGIGIFISQNINHILRMIDGYPNEPKIASRYITDPVLFYRSDLGANVKFDIRYMVLLSSVEPLRAFTTKVFWLRFANKQFVLRNWDDYETHFTVMNYKDQCQLKNIGCEEFRDLFDHQYPAHPWSSVEILIHKMLRTMLEDVTKGQDPFRVHPSPQSRGMYAVDLMLEWSRDGNGDGDTAPRIVPRVCEVNYCPDCTRACKYHPDFFNDVFSTLFLDQPAGVVELLPAEQHQQQ